MVADPWMVPIVVVGLPQLPASILALPDMEATVMPPDTVGRVIFAFPLISACTMTLRTYGENQCVVLELVLNECPRALRWKV